MADTGIEERLAPGLWLGGNDVEAVHFDAGEDEPGNIAKVSVSQQSIGQPSKPLDHVLNIG